jgi:hypothetical protein
MKVEIPEIGALFYACSLFNDRSQVICLYFLRRAE